MRLLFFATIFLSTFVALAHSKVLTWACEFDERTSREGIAKERFDLVFKVDTTSQKAYMEGNTGIAELEMHIGEDAFSFMEKVSSGTVQTTTITRDGLAVHSRNTVIAGQFVAAQFHGLCCFE